jgi:hypothetical protein
MRKTFRYLRITVSVLSLTTCVLLVALWVRSYRAREEFRGFLGKHVLSIPSARGELGIGLWGWQSNSFGWTLRSDSDSEDTKSLWPPAKGRPPLSSLGIHWFRSLAPDMTLLIIPYWLLVLSTATIAAATWVWYSRQFRLRTMFIAWTLVAALLGLIAWHSS